MAETKRVLPVLIAHFAVGLACCAGYAFFTPVGAHLIEPFVGAYRFRFLVLLFIDWMPALQISGLLVGYSLAFGKSASSVERWSGTLLSFLKGAFLLCIACIALYVALADGVAPMLASRQNEAVSRTGDYEDSLALARKAMLDGNYLIAEFQSAVALQVWGKSREATELHEQAKYKLAAEKTAGSGVRAESGKTARSGHDESGGSLQALPGSAGMTVLQALDRAEAAMKSLDYYSAHYYAMMAYRLAPGTDPNREKALRVGSAAWNKIGEGLAAAKMGDDRELYETKRRGYDAIQGGDYLSAYYIFKDLYDKSRAPGSKKIDPDVDRFLAVARQGMLSSFFFMDETGNVKQFESARDVFFVIRRKDGASDIVFAQGVSWVRSGGMDVAYLRGFEFARIGWDGEIQYRIAVPYVKMFPYPGSSGAQPELLLHAVDRERKGVETVPRLLAGTLSDADRNILLLDMPYRDFSLVLDMNKGLDSMSILDLLKFERKADSYGFSGKAIRCELINRLADPFLTLILSIYALILAWRFRLASNVLFKAWWVIFIPLFPLLSIFAMELVRYASRLCVVTVVRMVPSNPALLVLLLLSLWFVGVSVYFFSQRSE